MAAVVRPSWWPRWRLRAWARDGVRLWLLLLLLGSVQGPWHVRAGQAVEYLKREHSLSKPYQGVGTSSSSLWNLMGNAMVMTQYIRLTPDMQSKQGALWNRVRVFPYISAMVNNGSLSYDHERDGRPTELGGCTAIVRNLRYDTFLVIRYVKRHLTIMMDIDGKHEWRDCIEMPGVRLPRGYYFGTSSITGDLSDNHDVISLKLFELTGVRTPEEEKMHRDAFLPSVDNLKLPEMTVPPAPLSGLALFLIVFFSLVFSVFAIVIGIILYNKWQDQSRKRFY
ncbi:VIP36-like protein isoform X4 [Onychomys torridus]|uniref:VIP36-like protein isoform X4 n=1 Tax=Onychomys torridus TaxID=38674 RepID=UPI00167F518C|nr:VIP36-like protein isoform X4 [Onychomys torridus]